MVVIYLKQGGFNGLMELLGALIAMSTQSILFDVAPDRVAAHTTGG